MREMHELRENLVAHGIAFQTVNVLIEMGFHDKLAEQESLIESALNGTKQAVSSGGLSRVDLQDQLAALVSLERDIAHTRRIAREQGLNLPALNALTQMIRQNPGDKGQKVINDFLAYALACDVKLSGIDEILRSLDEEPQSVLPQIERTDAPADTGSRKTLYRDIALGLAMAFGIMWLIV